MNNKKTFYIQLLNSKGYIMETTVHSSVVNIYNRVIDSVQFN